MGLAQKVAELTPCRRAARRAALPLCEGENKAAHFVGSFSPRRGGDASEASEGVGSATFCAQPLRKPHYFCAQPLFLTMLRDFFLEVAASPCNLALTGPARARVAVLPVPSDGTGTVAPSNRRTTNAYRSAVPQRTLCLHPSPELPFDTEPREPPCGRRRAGNGRRLDNLQDC